MLDGITDSWLDVTISRPEGASAGELDADETVEERTVLLTGHGSRWAGLAIEGAQ